MLDGIAVNKNKEGEGIEKRSKTLSEVKPFENCRLFQR